MFVILMYDHLFFVAVYHLSLFLLNVTPGTDRMLKEVVESNLNKEMDAGVILTQILLSHPPQRMLFAGSELGQIRAFAFPLSGEFNDYVCHGATVTRLRLSHADTYVRFSRFCVFFPFSASVTWFFSSNWWIYVLRFFLCLQV
jgi:hypothetical protein